MENPFYSLDARLSNIEALLKELNSKQSFASVVPVGESRSGNFNWYLAETGEAESTARQRIARGEVPGVTKLGKRLLFEKAIVRQWIKDNQRQTVTDLTAEAETLFRYRHTSRKKKGGQA